jgi:hypothetical protein
MPAPTRTSQRVHMRPVVRPVPRPAEASTAGYLW